MPKTQVALPALLLILALGPGLYLTIQPSFGQGADDASQNASSSGPGHTQPVQHADNDNNDPGRSSATTFQGRIVRSGNRLVLAALDSTTYQLDNQREAHNFLNQYVRVTGSLDATTGMIRIHAIDPV